MQQELRIVAYYPSWSARGATPYQVTDIPAERITHINYAFANISAETGQIMLGNPQADTDLVYAGDNHEPRALHGHFNQLVLLKEKYPHLKTLISVGGWTWSGHFSDAAASEEARRRFARSCAAFAARYDFDGVDIDWEYPASKGMQEGRPEDTVNFTLLLAELRRQLDGQSQLDGREYLLTIATPAGPTRVALIEVDRIHPYLDWINVMAYDFAGPGSPLTSFNAPLCALSQSKDDDLPRVHTHAAIQAHLDGGAPPDKVVLGVPFYGKAWKGVLDKNNGLYQPHEGGAELRTGYRDLVANELYGMRRFWHQGAQVPWLYDAEKGIVISYDDPESMRLKGEYARAQGLGGLMFWQVTSDDGEHSLLKALTEGYVSKGLIE